MGEGPCRLLSVFYNSRTLCLALTEEGLPVHKNGEFGAFKTDLESLLWK